MRPFQTISQIVIATSVISCALAAPLTEDTHDARTDMSQLERRLSPEAKTILMTAPFAGIVAGVIGGLTGQAQKWMNAALIPTHRRSVTELGNDAISRSLTSLSDEDLQLLGILSRRAIESLD